MQASKCNVFETKYFFYCGVFFLNIKIANTSLKISNLKLGSAKYLGLNKYGVQNEFCDYKGGSERV
jgi:hypothetical protein